MTTTATNGRIRDNSNATSAAFRYPPNAAMNRSVVAIPIPPMKPKTNNRWKKRPMFWTVTDDIDCPIFVVRLREIIDVVSNS